MNNSSSRIVYLDLLRALAVIGVITVHTSAMMVIEYPDTSGIVWKCINAFNGFGRFAVPVFIMLTGGLLLNENRHMDTGFFYKTRLLSLIKLLVGWVLAYGIFYATVLPWLLNKSASWEAFWGYLIRFDGSDCPHLWYMFMVVGIYLLIPIFRLFVKKENKTIILYVIIISFVTQYLPELLNIITDLSGATSSVSDFMDKFLLSPVGGFVGILLTGWYIITFEIDKKNRYIIYVLGIVSFVGSILLTQFLMESVPSIREYTYIHFSFCPVMTATALVVLFKELFNERRRTPKLIAGISNLSLGIYLIHVFYVEIFYRVLLHYEKGLMHPIPYFFLETLFVFVMSYLTALLLSRFKFSRKWISIKKSQTAI